MHYRHSPLIGWRAWALLLAALLLSVPATAEDIEFESHGARLSGSIVLPETKAHAAIVFVHGSGKQSRNLKLAQQFAAAGIAALVYDKRGVGKSWQRIPI